MAKVSSSSLPAVEFDASSAVSSGQQLRDALSQQARCLLDSGTRRLYIRRPLLALHHVPCSPIAARPVPCTMSMSAPCLVRFSLSRRSFRPACCLLLAVPSARRVRSLTYCLLLAISNSWRARSLTARRATDLRAIGNVVGGYGLAQARLGRTTGSHWVIFVAIKALFIWRLRLTFGSQAHVEPC